MQLKISSLASSEATLTKGPLGSWETNPSLRDPRLSRSKKGKRWIMGQKAVNYKGFRELMWVGKLLIPIFLTLQAAEKPQASRSSHPLAGGSPVSDVQCCTNPFSKSFPFHMARNKGRGPAGDFHRRYFPLFKPFPFPRGKARWSKLLSQCLQGCLSEARCDPAHQQDLVQKWNAPRPTNSLYISATLMEGW